MLLIAAIGCSMGWLLLFIKSYIKVPPVVMLQKQLLFPSQMKKYQQEKAKTKAKKKSNNKLEESKLIVYPAYAAFTSFQLERRLSQLLHYLHSFMLQLHRQQWSFEQTLQAFIATLGQALLVLICSLWFSVLSKETALFVVGLLISIIIFIRLFQEAKKQVQLRKQAILLELPLMLTRLTLLVGAGETVQQAFIKTVAGREQSQHPLHVEWSTVVYELSNGASFTACLEKLNRNCSVQQIAVLTTIILLNYRRGGEQFVTAVQDISLSLWETRKNMARTKGEEASSKLIFPLVGVLFLLMIIIMAPAISYMKFL